MTSPWRHLSSGLPSTLPLWHHSDVISALTSSCTAWASPPGRTLPAWHTSTGPAPLAPPSTVSPQDWTNKTPRDRARSVWAAGTSSWATWICRRRLRKRSMKRAGSTREIWGKWTREALWPSLDAARLVEGQGGEGRREESRNVYLVGGVFWLGWVTVLLSWGIRDIYDVVTILP